MVTTTTCLVRYSILLKAKANNRRQEVVKILNSMRIRKDKKYEIFFLSG